MNEIPKSIVACVFLVSLVSAVWAENLAVEQPAPEAMASELGMTLPRLPWHLADIWWVFADPTKHFESLSVEVTIDRDIPSSYNLYISPVGIAKINGQQFYGGLQSNVNGWATKDSRTRVHPGKGAIFSRWSHDTKQPIGLDHVRMAADGLCESAGYEGEFCSVRRPFAWTKGTYTYSIVKGDQETVKEQAHTWFHCLVRSHETDDTTYIGSLRFKGQDFTFWDRNAAFVEVYSTSKIPRSGIPRLTVTFGYPRINGVRQPLKTASVNYNAAGSPPCATVRVKGESVEVTVGKIFNRTKEKSHHVLHIEVPPSAGKATPSKPDPGDGT